jgi:hypothetical protein
MFALALEKAGRVGIPFQQNKKNTMILTVFVTVNIVILFAILAMMSLNLQFEWGRVAERPIQSQMDEDDKLGPYITCPEDPFLARQENCSFDLLANGWIPAPCFDSAMHHDFVDGKDYGFFEDKLGVRKVHQNTIMEGNISMYPEGLWVTFDEHFEHCRNLLNGSVRAIAPPFTGFLDTFHDEGHLQHCIGVLSESRDPYILRQL